MTTQDELAALREQVEAARLSVELERLKATAGMLETGRRHIPEAAIGPGAVVDRYEYLTDGAGISDFGFNTGLATHIALPDDYANGDNRPYWTSEQEWRQIVGLCRVLATMSEVGLSALENLTNYTIGQGFTYTVVPQRDDDEAAFKWAQLGQRIVDNLLEESKFENEGERSVFEESRVDGDAMLGLRHRGGLNVELVYIDPPSVTEPDVPGELEAYMKLPIGLDWKYGIATEQGRPNHPLAYFVTFAGNEHDWEVFTSDRLVHIKLNSSRFTKRGMPDFYPVENSLRGGEKLLRNTIGGSAVQAAIAYIREHAPGVTSDTISDLVGTAAERSFNEPTQSGTKERNLQRAVPGTVVDVTNQMKYHAGPLGSPNGPSFIQVVQAAWRTAGIRWQMPEYMISGDASNGNYASTLVAEAPFTKATEARQAVYLRAYRELCWKAVALVARYTGLFGDVPLTMLKRRLEIQVDGPEVAVRNKMEDHQIRMEELDRGLVSETTAAAEAGRNLEEERQLGAAARPEPTPAPIAESLWKGYP